MNDELKDLLKRVRHAKEILGMGGYDHAYRANKVLEVVAAELRHLCKVAADDAEKTWAQFNRFPGSACFYGCVAPDGTWFDSAVLFTNAVHHCAYAAGEFELSPAQELKWMDESAYTHGYSVIHSSLLERMYEKGLLK